MIAMREWLDIILSSDLPTPQKIQVVVAWKVARGSPEEIARLEILSELEDEYELEMMD